MVSRVAKGLAALTLMISSAAVAQGNWQVTATWKLGGEGQWDYVTVDSGSHRVFVTRTTHTQVIDGNDGKLLGDIPGLTQAHGVALAPAIHRGFITDGGGAGAILIFDLNTYAVLGKLAAMPDTDGIIYDAELNRVFAVSGDGHALLTFKADVDPASGKIEAPISLGGSPEFLASDGAGRVYINLQDKDLVAVVDVAARQVTARWPVAPGGAPTGLAMDKVHHSLFIGCRKPQKMIVMSANDGKVLAALPIGAGVDATSVDGVYAFASCRDGSLSVIRETNGTFSVEQVVHTAVGARTIGSDVSTHQHYLPAALFEQSSAGSTPGRPKAVPGTFMLIVVKQGTSP